MNLIEQLKDLTRYSIEGRESTDGIWICGSSSFGDKLYTSPQQSNTELITELVEALEDANNKIKKAKAFNYQAEMYISESEYELDGFLGTTAADISVNWQSTIDSNNALLTKAREAIK